MEEDTQDSVTNQQQNVSQLSDNTNPCNMSENQNEQQQQNGRETHNELQHRNLSHSSGGQNDESSQHVQNGGESNESSHDVPEVFDNVQNNDDSPQQYRRFHQNEQMSRNEHNLSQAMRSNPQHHSEIMSQNSQSDSIHHHYHSSHVHQGQGGNIQELSASNLQHQTRTQSPHHHLPHQTIPTSSTSEDHVVTVPTSSTPEDHVVTIPQESNPRQSSRSASQHHRHTPSSSSSTSSSPSTRPETRSSSGHRRNRSHTNSTSSSNRRKCPCLVWLFAAIIILAALIITIITMEIVYFTKHANGDYSQTDDTEKMKDKNPEIQGSSGSGRTLPTKPPDQDPPSEDDPSQWSSEYDNQSDLDIQGGLDNPENIPGPAPDHTPQSRPSPDFSGRYPPPKTKPPKHDKKTTTTTPDPGEKARIQDILVYLIAILFAIGVMLVVCAICVARGACNKQRCPILHNYCYINEDNLYSCNTRHNSPIEELASRSRPHDRNRMRRNRRNQRTSNSTDSCCSTCMQEQETSFGGSPPPYSEVASPIHLPPGDRLTHIAAGYDNVTFDLSSDGSRVRLQPPTYEEVLAQGNSSNL